MPSKLLGIGEMGVKLSTRGEYGLRAMVGLAASYGTGPTPLSELAQRERVSPAYLEQLLAALRRQGLVETTRGARGGYQLSAHPKSISVGDVVRALEGPIELLDCVSDEAGEALCDRLGSCPTRTMWQRVRDSIAEVLDSTSLADLVNNPAEIRDDSIRSTSNGDNSIASTQESASAQRSSNVQESENATADHIP